MNKKFKLIQKGFNYLNESCEYVAFLGIVNKDAIPKESTCEDDIGEYFNHEFNNTKTDGWDEDSFWGDIYLPFINDEYMRFEVFG